MKQDKNIEKSMFPYPVNPVNPVKKLFQIKSTKIQMFFKDEVFRSKHI